MSQANESLSYLLSLPLEDYAVFYWDVGRVKEIYVKWQRRYDKEAIYVLTTEQAREVISKLQYLDISLGISDDDIVDLIDEVIEGR